MMELRRGLLSVSDEDLMALADDTLSADKKSASLLESARKQREVGDG